MGGLTYSFVAIEHPNCPPIKSKIRGEMRKGGWRVTPINATSCTVAFISVCDLKRSVPKSLALKGECNATRERSFGALTCISMC